MDTSSRRDLIKKLVEQRKNMKHTKVPNKPLNKTDFVAFINPTEGDIMDELVRLDGFTSKEK